MDDIQPRDVQKEIDDLVKQHRIVLFMKGNPTMPQCGFSARAVQVLTAYTDDFVTVNVLQDPEVREGVKVYSNWPTIPQLYVDGKFVGGSDILYEMHMAGELEGVLAGGGGAH
jgi:monothiol glutaredoxin